MVDNDGRSKEDIAGQQAGEEILEIPNPPPGVSEPMTGSGSTELTVEEQNALSRLGMRSDPPQADAVQPIEFKPGLPPASTQPNRGEPASNEDEGDNEAGQRAEPCRRLVRVPCKDGWNVVYQHSSGSCVTYGPYDRVGNKMMLHDDDGFEFFAYRGGRELYVVDGTEVPTGLQPEDMEESALFKIEGTTDEAPVEELAPLPQAEPPAEESPNSDSNPPDCPGIQIHPLPDGKVTVIVDGEQSQAFDEVGAVSYDDQGRAYFAARQDNMWFVFHHPDVHGPYDKVYDLTFRKGKLTFFATYDVQVVAFGQENEPAPVVELVKPVSLPRMARSLVGPPVPPAAPPPAAEPVSSPVPSARPSSEFALEQLTKQPQLPPASEPSDQAAVVTGFTPQELKMGQGLFAPLPPPSGKKGKGIIRRVAGKVWKAVSRPAPTSGKKLKVKQVTPRKARPFFKVFMASLILFAMLMFGISAYLWFWKSEQSLSIHVDQPIAAPVRTGATPVAPTATKLLACEREERDMSTASLSLVARASKGTKWQATGDATCFQIDLVAWSTVALGVVPGKVQAIVDCTKSKRSNATDRQRDGQPCWDVTDCVVASCRGWPR